ncbi:hypothetical protein [Nakamurella sp.]|uniref:hypothetical protein n=1 Tax=Nakamurella sp. TaxID=1869182 RepID=UPI0037846EE0
MFRQLVVVRPHAAHELGGESGATAATLDQRDTWVAALATMWSAGPTACTCAAATGWLTTTTRPSRATLRRGLVERPSPAAARTAARLHGPMPGVRGGVLIDTRALRSVRSDGRSAVLGAGATWADVNTRSGRRPA